MDHLLAHILEHALKLDACQYAVKEEPPGSFGFIEPYHRKLPRLDRRRTRLVLPVFDSSTCTYFPQPFPTSTPIREHEHIHQTHTHTHQRWVPAVFLAGRHVFHHHAGDTSHADPAAEGGSSDINRYLKYLYPFRRYVLRLQIYHNITSQIP